MASQATPIPWHDRAGRAALHSYIHSDIVRRDEAGAVRGRLLKQLRGLPKPARDDLGFQLYRLQLGRQPTDFKPMPAVGPGVEEIRVRDASGAYRAIYTARLADAIYVLHVFQKKTQATGRQDIELAAKRYAALLRRQR